MTRSGPSNREVTITGSAALRTDSTIARSCSFVNGTGPSFVRRREQRDAASSPDRVLDVADPDGRRVGGRKRISDQIISRGIVKTGVEDEIRDGVESFRSQIREVLVRRGRTSLRSRVRLHGIPLGSKGAPGPSGNKRAHDVDNRSGYRRRRPGDRFFRGDPRGGPLRLTASAPLESTVIESKPHVQGLANDHTAVLAGGLLEPLSGARPFRRRALRLDPLTQRKKRDRIAPSSTTFRRTGESSDECRQPERSPGGRRRPREPSTPKTWRDPTRCGRSRSARHGPGQTAPPRQRTCRTPFRSTRKRGHTGGPASSHEYPPTPPYDRALVPHGRARGLGRSSANWRS